MCLNIKEDIKNKVTEKIKEQTGFENEERLQSRRKDIEKEIYGDESAVKKASSVIMDDLALRFNLNSAPKRIALFAIIEIVLIYFAHYLFYPITQIGAMISKAKPDSFIKSLRIMAESSPFFFTVMLVICFVIGLKIITMHHVNIDNADDRKLEFLGKSAKEHGTAHFMDRKEQLKAFNVVKKNKLKPTDGMILAENKNNEYICMPWETGRGQDTAPNRNMIITGPPGTRKSTGVLLPLVLQVLGMGYTCFVTDPKGEILRKTVATAIRYGYKIQVLNLRGDQFLHSSGWDCLGTVKRSRVPDETAQDFASIVMENTETTSATDKFWFDGELNLCKFLVLYVAHSKNFKPYIGTGDAEYQGLKENAKLCGCRVSPDMINEKGFLVKGNKELVNRYRNIDQVYAHITNLLPTELQEIVNNLPVNDISRKAGVVWVTNKQSIQIVASLATRLQIFQSPLVSKIFSTDEINFRKMAKEKTICYIINSDQSNSYQFLMALFMTFALIEFANMADASKNETLKVPAYFVIEEGKSVGKIPGCATKLSTCRARSMNVILSWQGIPQMESIYSGQRGKKEWEEILACCSTKIFLGAGDPTTARYISNRFNVGSVKITSKRRTVSIFNPLHISDRETRDTSEKRRLLMTEGEVSELAKNKITVSSDSISGVLYQYKSYYLNLPEARDRVFRKDGSKLEVKTGNYYPVWRQIEDIQRHNTQGSVDLSNLVPQFEEKEVEELIKGQDEIIVKRLKKENTLKKLYDIFTHSVDKDEGLFEADTETDYEGLSKDREYDEMHGGIKGPCYDAAKLSIASDEEAQEILAESQKAKSDLTSNTSSESENMVTNCNDESNKDAELQNEPVSEESDYGDTGPQNEDENSSTVITEGDSFEEDENEEEVIISTNENATAHDSTSDAEEQDGFERSAEAEHNKKDYPKEQPQNQSKTGNVKKTNSSNKNATKKTSSVSTANGSCSDPEAENGFHSSNAGDIEIKSETIPFKLGEKYEKHRLSNEASKNQKVMSEIMSITNDKPEDKESTSGQKRGDTEVFRKQFEGKRKEVISTGSETENKNSK